MHNYLAYLWEKNNGLTDAELLKILPYNIRNTVTSVRAGAIFAGACSLVLLFCSTQNVNVFWLILGVRVARFQTCFFS